jgi:hypothetical protein
MPSDVRLFSAILRDLRHMEVHQLKIENIDFMLRALAHSVSFLGAMTTEERAFYNTEVEAFLP